jgi:hypothetical protein
VRGRELAIINNLRINLATEVIDVPDSFFYENNELVISEWRLRKAFDEAWMGLSLGVWLDFLRKQVCHRVPWSSLYFLLLAQFMGFGELKTILKLFWNIRFNKVTVRRGEEASDVCLCHRKSFSFRKSDFNSERDAMVERARERERQAAA